MSTPLRIGMIVPSSNTVVEPVSQRLVVEFGDAVLHSTRIGVTRVAVGAESDGQFGTQSMVDCAKLLADAKVDIVLWNGTSGSWRGIEVDRDLVAALRMAANVEATTSTLALVAACRAFGVKRLGIATPYTSDINLRIVEVFAERGIRVMANSALGLQENFVFAETTAQTVADQVRSVATGVDAVAVICTNVDASTVVSELETELGIPVFDSVSVSLWHAAHIAGRMVSMAESGRLLRDGSLHMALHDVCDELLTITGADRVTIRLDDDRHGLNVTLPAAEAIAPGVRSIAREGGLDQRALETVKWLDSAETHLVQPRFVEAPFPPDALINVYGVAAQMLGAVRSNEVMVGWVSAHSLTERDWSDSDTDALDAATAKVLELVR